MSNIERTGVRSLAYSRWHRPASIRRFLNGDWRLADSLCMIDVDACEFCKQCSTPLALIETQVSRHRPKDARVLSVLARMAGVRAFSVSVALTDDEPEGFLVRQLVPASDWVEAMTPTEYAQFLVGLRAAHVCEVQAVA